MVLKPEAVAKILKDALKGPNSKNETEIIIEIAKHTNHQRQSIKESYLAMYGNSLEEDIKAETSFHFGEGLLALLEQTDEYEAKCLRKAMDGLLTDERTIIQTLCPKESHEIIVIKNTYNKVFKRDLERDLEKKINRSLGCILKLIVSGSRSDSVHVDSNLAKKEAQKLYNAGEGKFGTNESEFVRILSSRSFPQLNATFDEYSKISKIDIIKAINNEMSGNLGTAFKAIVRAAKNKSAYFAHEINGCVAGLGTRDQDLIRLLVSKHEYNFQEIKNEYLKQYGESLYDAIKSDTSGFYQLLFLLLIGQ